MAIQISEASTFDFRARLTPFKIHQPATNLCSIKVQVSRFDVLSRTIQQKPNARINPPRTQRHDGQVDDESRAIRGRVE